MGRKKVVDGIRIDMWIERTDLKLLEDRKVSSGINVSEQIRLAVKQWLGQDTSEVPNSLKTIHRPSKEVLDMIKYISQMLPEGRQKVQTIEMKKDPMMLLFSKEWFKLKQMMEMTVEVLRAKMMPDIIFEEDTYPIEVSGTNRTRQHRAGFKIDFGKKFNRGELEVLIRALDKEMGTCGKIVIIGRR